MKKSAVVLELSSKTQKDERAFLKAQEDASFWAFLYAQWLQMCLT